MNKYLKIFSLIIGLVSTAMCFHVFLTLIFLSNHYTIIEPRAFIRILEFILSGFGVILLTTYIYKEIKTFI